MTGTTYILKSNRTNSVLCIDGEYRHFDLIGPNQWTPKTFQTKHGAEKAILNTGRPDLEATQVGA